MVASSVNGVAIRGIVCGVPAHVEVLADIARRFGEDAARRIAEATGIESRHIVTEGQCLGDLIQPAAARLLQALDWAAGDIDLLVAVTQTADERLPGAALRLHRQLGLPTRTAAFDVNLGCSGYVYGLWMVSSLLRSLGARRALLVAGDVTSRLIDPDDRAVAPLFGDAVAVTALETDEAAAPMTFVLGSDGAGGPYLTASCGGIRAPDQPPRLFMDGTQVFAFTLREVPGNIAATLAAAGLPIDAIDFVVMHQANRQMLERLARKIGAAPPQMVYALSDYGNTSSASIPLAMTTKLTNRICPAKVNRFLLSAFGVGWSWGSCVLSINSDCILDTAFLSL